MNENEYVSRILSEIKAIKSELKYLRDNPIKDKPVYQALNRSDVLEQRLEELENRLENI